MTVTVNGNNSSTTAYDLSGDWALTSDSNVYNSGTIPHASAYSVTEAGMTDWYVFTITATSTVTLDIDHGMYDFDPWLNLYNSSLTLIAANDDSHVDPGSAHFYDSYMSLTLAPGTYYVQVARVPNTTLVAGGDYTLHFSAANVVTTTFDTTAPGAPTLDLADLSDTGSSNSDNVTSDTNPTLQGVAEAGSSVEVYEGTTLLGTTTTDSAGNWSLTLSSPLAEGVHDLNAYATDSSDNTSVASLTLTVTFDTSMAAPTIDLDSGSDSGSSDSDDLTNDGAPTFTGTAEAGSTVELYDGTVLVGMGTADGDGNWSISAALTGDGEHVLYVTSTDLAGNTAHSGLLTVTLDTAIATPTIDLDSASDSGVSDSDDLTNDSAPTLNGTAEAGSAVSVYEGTTLLGTATADGSGNWTMTLAAALADGAHTLHATATDTAGNTSDPSGDLTITVDTVIATPTIDQTSVETDQLANLEGTAEANSSVAIRDGDGNLVATVSADGDGNWAYEVESPLMDGEWTYSATATDAAGNESASASTTVCIVVDGQVFNGGNGADVLTGTNGRDTLNGGNGTDSLYGGWAPDSLFGGNGDDYLDGGAGNDMLYGENGADTLDGGAGYDTLDGGRGDDMLTGGAGPDDFVIGKSSGNDTITDFEVGSDGLVLNDELSVASLQHVGDDTLVHLSNGGIVTLLGVTLASADDLFPPPEPTCFCGESIDTSFA